MAAALSACGGSSPTSEPPPGIAGAGPELAQPIQLANCTDWKNGSVEERFGTIAQLRNFAGGPVVGANAKQPAGRGAVLDDEKAYDLFETACDHTYARGFQLYRLYQRAAAFSGQPAG